MNGNSTRFRPPESDGKKHGQRQESGTDFASLMAAEAEEFASLAEEAAATKRKEKAPVATDFQSLKGVVGSGAPKPYQRRSGTDLLLDFLTPLMILIMVTAVVFFLLDVRFVYTEVHDRNIRFVAFCFVLGVVALNRLIARDGKDESIMYIVGLALAIGLYTLATTTAYEVGSVAARFMGQPGVALGFNMTVVIFVWWLVNRLTHECCVDENRTAGDIGILTGTARRFKEAVERKPAPSLSDATLDAIDPTEWKKPEKKRSKPILDPTERLSKRHPGISIFYFSIPVMIAFALGQRVIQHGGPPMLLAGHVYIACYTIAALSLLMLSSLSGLREYFRARRVKLPGRLGTFWIGLGSVMVLMVLFAAAVIPGPSLPPIAHVAEHEYDPWNRGSTFQLQSVVSPAVDVIQQNHVVDFIGYGVLLCFGLFFLYGLLRAAGAIAVRIGRNRDRYPRFVVRFFNALDAFLERITRMPELPKLRRKRIRVDRSIATCARIENPMAQGPALNTEQRIERCYDALCALAYDLGVPRRIDQTPNEFIEAFPVELNSLREEAYELTDLYVRSAYANAKFDERTEDRLRRFWITYERARNRVLR
ncbi:MAG: DUF4129 domain-containing protein [Candidatus Hydrogenedentes bacterium]|nr:DUF4129 domain-containing protein [Candidatus Hydrogenedentota bacterium]